MGAGFNWPIDSFVSIAEQEAEYSATDLHRRTGEVLRLVRRGQQVRITDKLREVVYLVTRAAEE